MYWSQPLLAALLGFVLSNAIHASTLELVVGSGKGEGSGPKLDAPFGVDFDSKGTMFLVEMVGQRVRVVDNAGTMKVIAGTGKEGDAGDGGPGKSATFNGPHSLAVGKDGDIYIADTWNNRVRRIDAKLGTIHGFAGTGEKGFGGDGGPAAKTQFGGVYCIAFSPGGGKMYLADLDNRRIRAIDMATGIVETVAGNGERGEPSDTREAKNSPLVDPRAVAADKDGNIYVLERKGNALRVVDASGHIRTVIGPGVKNLSDEEGKPPLPLKGPKHLCVDLDGSVLIADSDNHMIRRYVPSEKKLIRVAGTGKAGAVGVGGDALAAQLNQPHGVTVHSSGEIYLSDSSNNRVVSVER